MKNSNFIIRIPEPCHEDWNKMQPEEKGRFCNSCNKTVLDFSNKTDVEIKSILDEQKNQQVCGHFKKSQVNRPLNYKIDFNSLPKNISTTKAFAIALFLVFGSILFSCTNEQNESLKVVGELMPPTQQELTVLGGPMAVTEATVESIENLDTVDGEVITESYVLGGIGSYNDNVILNDTIKHEADSVIEKTEYFETMGMMVVEIAGTDTTANDSTPVQNTVTRIGDNVIATPTDLSVYPNPSTGEFTIKYDVTKRADVKIDIYDLKGVLVKEVVNQPSQYEGKYQIPVNLNELPAGVYVVNLINNGKLFNEKIVIGK